MDKLNKRNLKIIVAVIAAGVTARILLYYIVSR
jgi:hypothetical protein